MHLTYTTFFYTYRVIQLHADPTLYQIVGQNEYPDKVKYICNLFFWGFCIVAGTQSPLTPLKKFSYNYQYAVVKELIVWRALEVERSLIEPKGDHNNNTILCLSVALVWSYFLSKTISNKTNAGRNKQMRLYQILLPVSDLWL